MPRRFLLPMVLTVMLLWSSDLGSAATQKNILLARGRTEPVVAVDPRNPLTIVAGSNTDYNTPTGDLFPTAYFTSHDGGKSFVAGAVPILRPYTTGADPTVAFARDGTVFFSYLGETPAFCSGGSSAVLLTHSRDGGRSFAAPVLVDANPADDKPNMSVESIPGKRSHIFVSWTRWHDKSSDLWFARSLDGGVTFSKPVLLQSSRLNNFGSVPVVGPDHRVYVFWSVFPDVGLTALNRTELYLRASADDGGHFAVAHRAVGPFSTLPQMAQPGSLRNFTAPAVAVGRDGVLYLAWAAVSRRLAGGAADGLIQLSRSADGGKSWTKPVRVNDSSRSDRFMPSISVLPDGSLGIAFYDRRANPGQLDVYAARATFDGVLHVSRNVRVNQGSSSISDIYYIPPGSTCLAPGRFFGDYIGTAACGADNLCVVWTDTQLHVYQETDVWFARVRMPATVIVSRALKLSSNTRFDTSLLHFYRVLLH